MIKCISQEYTWAPLGPIGTPLVKRLIQGIAFVVPSPHFSIGSFDSDLTRSVPGIATLDPG